MKGFYTSGLAYVPINVAGMRFNAIVDTGFSGDLLLPKSIIEGLQLPFKGTVNYVTADGDGYAADVHKVTIEWLGKARSITVVAGESGGLVLLGMGLLYQYRTLLYPIADICDIQATLSA